MKKEVIGLAIFIIIISLIMICGMERFKRIDNGEMIIASQNEMDR